LANCGHERVEVISRCPDCGQELGRGQFSRAELAQKGGLSQEEIAAQTGSELPDREQMSLVNANVAAPINLAAALNVLSDGSIAYANATQNTPITQGIGAPAPTQST
jgi:hypothetical protein